MYAYYVFHYVLLYVSILSCVFITLILRMSPFVCVLSGVFASFNIVDFYCCSYYVMFHSYDSYYFLLLCVFTMSNYMLLSYFLGVILFVMFWYFYLLFYFISFSFIMGSLAV